MTIGRTIKRLRLNSGISKSELARRVGVSATAVHNWENGTIPRDDLLPRIASALGATVTSVTGKAPPPTASGAPTARDAAAAVAGYKAKIAELYGIRPDQVEVCITF